MATPREGKGRTSFVLASGGLLCAAALVPAAFLAPVYSGESVDSSGAVVHTTNTFVGVNGLWVAGLLSVPLFLALVTWIGLRLRCSRDSVLGTRLAWAAVILLWAFTVASFSLGVLILPSALLLVVAAKTTPTSSVGAAT